MKKFLTVLLVIAVMFTFSFGSAFAANEQTGEYGTKGDVKELRYATAYADENGEYGITEAYKENLVESVEAIDYETDYYVPEQATAKAAVEKAIADIKAATTAVQAKAVDDKLTSTLAKLKKTAMTAKYGSYGSFETALADEITFVGRSAAAENLLKVGESKNESYVLLEGYGYFNATKLDERTDKFENLDPAEKTTILDWMFDNNYRTVTEMKDHMADLLAAMKPVNAAYADAVVLEFDKLDARVTAFGKKLDNTGYKATVSIADLEVAETLIDDIAAFNSKYCSGAVLGKIAALYGITGNGWANEPAAKKAICYAANLFLNQYYAQIEALPAATRLTDADKATVIDLNKKVVALEDEYATKYNAVKKYLPSSANVAVENKAKLTAAVNEFKNADSAALAKLFNYAANKNTAFSVTVPGVGNTVVFDASEDNLSKLAAAKKAYDEYVANYAERTSSYEAQLLAAEWNKDAAAGYDDKADKLENSKVQAYLNNGEVKVTTKAIGKGKVRVQAKVDAASFAQIVKEMGEGSTITYQFYYKKAANTAYKAGKVKTVNYTTFKLAKGTKYNFRCQVVIKDADGKVVATKDYKASTVGTRTVK